MRFNEKETGARIKELRDGKNMKQADLAAELNFSRNYVSMIEKGERIPSVGVYVAIADYFGVSMDYLLLGRIDKVRKAQIQVAIDILEKIEKGM